MIKKILILLLSVTIVMSSSYIAFSQNFIDVPEDHPYKSEIEFCREKDFVQGTGSNMFMPNGKLTRAQLATIWCRTLSLEDVNHNFKDITSLKNYYDTPTIVLRSLGIINGTSETSYSPNINVTREQLASITMRTYRLGVADPDAYQQYTDHASISEWARDGVSACINAEIFKGLYDGETFKPSEPVTRAEICKLVYNVLKPAHTVTIGPLTGGTIVAEPNVAHAGEIITLTITPDSGKQLKAGSLKYNDVAITGNTFTMPPEDVLVTAEFEDIPEEPEPEEPEAVLESISVSSLPTKTTYTVGEELDLTGLVVIASYSGGEASANWKEVTGYTTTPAEGSELNTAGTVTITVSYTEGDITKTTTFDVQVDSQVE